MNIEYILKENCGHYNEYYMYYSNGHYRRMSIVAKELIYEMKILNNVIDDDISYQTLNN